MTQCTILVIDDDVTLLALLTDYLQMAGYRSLGANSGQQGLQLATEVEPDLVVREPAPMGTAWEAAPLPLLVVEVVSPSSRRHDYEVKRTFYADDARIPDYWIVDPEARRITVVNPGRTDAVFEESLVWHPSGAGAPLVIDVQGLFD